MFRNLFGQRAAQATGKTNASELKQRLDAGERLYLLDVRSAEEYRDNGHIAGSHLLPLSALSKRIEELPRDMPIVCICRSGHRSGVAAAQLARQGFSEVINLSGGMLAWSRAGLPTRRG